MEPTVDVVDSNDPPRPKLKPERLKIAAVLGSARDVYFANWGTMVTITAVGYGVLILLQLAFGLQGTRSSVSNSGVSMPAVLGGLILALLIGPMMFGTLCVLSSRASSGAKPSVAAAVRRSARRLGWVILTTLCVGILTGIGFILVIVPGILLGGYLSLATCFIVLEQCSIGGAIKGSFAAVRGNFAPMFLILIVLGLIEFVTGVVLGVLSGLGGHAHPHAASLIATWAGQALVLPFIVTTLVVAYHKLANRPVCTPLAQEGASDPR